MALAAYPLAFWAAFFGFAYCCKGLEVEDPLP